MNLIPKVYTKERRSAINLHAFLHEKSLLYLMFVLYSNYLLKRDFS